MSVWDKPTVPEAPVDTTTTAKQFPPRDADMIDPKKRVYGTQAGPLLTPAGRGVVNGIPMGEVAQAREEALDAQYRYRPAWRARLDAATRKALGR